MVVLMGAGGAGKSTFATALNGLIPHFIKGEYTGTLEVCGSRSREEEVSRLADLIGLVFQDFETQLFSTTVELEIAFGMENRGWERDRMQLRIKEILSAVGLSGFENRAPSSLSGGQKQRLAIGAVLAAAPRVLCLDEPTTDLDPAGKQEIFGLLQRLRAGQGRSSNESCTSTILVIEHETEEAVQADRIIVLDRGRIVADGTPEAVLSEVPLFERVGLMPLPVCDYFHRLVPAEIKEQLPLTLEDGVRKFAQLGLSIDEARVRELTARDQSRLGAYGGAILRLEEVEFGYDDRLVLQKVDLCIREKEFVALLGANGSGKTTLAKQFNGLLRPSRGRVWLAGNDSADQSIFDMGQIVGYVFQNPDQQIFCDTVFDEVAYGPRLRGLSEAEVTGRVAEALAAVGLSGCELADPFSLSRGERQRVAVASVLSIKPKILVLDEPTTGLDYKDQRHMMELVKKLNEAGNTIVMITHTMWVVAEYAHRIVLFREGKVVADGQAREVFADEALLALSEVRPPQVTMLGNRLGCTALSLDELVDCTAGMR
jgi:energy-coupling factor transport system ATP-binding protein